MLLKISNLRIYHIVKHKHELSIIIFVEENLLSLSRSVEQAIIHLR